MPESRPIGRWLDTVTAANTRNGDLIWLPRAKGGTRGQVALVAGDKFAVIRPHRAAGQQQWIVRIEGFVWFPVALPEESTASRMGIKESAAGGFPTVAKARSAVAEAHRLLDEHLRRHAA